MARLSALPHRLQRAPERTAVAVGGWRAGKEGSAARGYGYRWQQYRLSYLRQHPLCVRCKALGMVVEATIVDHVVPHQGDQVLFWDERNHQALCKPCHDGDKAREERQAGHR